MRVQPRRFVPDWGPEGEQLAGDYVDLGNRVSNVAMERGALYAKSFAARHLLLRNAAGPGLTYTELIEHLRAHDVDDRRLGTGLPKLAERPTIQLARVIGLQGLEEEDEALAARLLTVVSRQHRVENWHEDHRKTYAHFLYAAGFHAELAHLLPRLNLPPRVLFPIQADLANPYASTVAKGEAEWLAAIARIFDGTGLETITFAPEGDTVFDRMRCAGVTDEVDGPLISVMMSSWRPDSALITSARSVLEQTWRNVELLVIDDASPPEFDAVLEQVAALDPERVRVVKQPVNGGTYLARNTALDLARGEFISGQDADDWSHPRRLEIQVRPLLKNRSVRATRGRSLRVSDDFVFNQPGYDPILFIAPFLMTRREDVRQFCGYYDHARKAADNEFLKRLVLGAPDGLVDVDYPLACQRVGHGSLSRSEFSAGWQHAARTTYQASYNHWHAELLRTGADRRLPKEQTKRPFPAPLRFVTGIPGATLPPNRYDVVVAGDWVTPDSTPRILLDQLRSLRGRGLRLGVLPLDTMFPPSPKRLPFATDLLDLIDRGEADFVLADQGAQVGLLLVHGAPVLQFPSTAPTDIGVARVAVLADRPPVSEGRRVYTVPITERSVSDLFGVDPVWVPQGPAVRAELAALVDPARLWDVDVPPVVDVDSWVVARSPLRDRRPVIGAMIRDTVGTWRTRAADLRATYPAPASGVEVDVRLRRVIVTSTGLLTHDGLPQEWMSFSEDDIAVRPFLAALDFYVPPANEDVTLETERGIREAMATGAVAVLPEQFRPAFGDAACYAAAGAAGDVVAELWANPGRYDAQSTRGVAFVREQFGAPAFADVVDGLRGAQALAGARSARTAAT
ncbi:glycosyltransferase family 2 protein [Sporichthya polymorpha]|uniref:glycosyltransferase family 2 protein n=1 Tax=Sporichthya polymorpha TaxID=35751 RepID=UPI000367CED7|nr:glycosyltransferase family A protein [Sporichthya polymorpha]